MFDWNDVRHFLAVAETGSTLAAGKRLRVSQTTVARRIAALEAALGLILFERRRAGYVLTEAGQGLLAEARGVEMRVHAFEAAAAAETREAAGTVRLTTEELFAHILLTPLLREFHALHPRIVIDLDVAEAVRDLGAGEADVALRAVKGPMPAGLVGRRLADDAWTIYCSRDYAETHGVPRRRRELHAHTLIGCGGGEVGRYYNAWIAENELSDAVAMVHGSSVGLLLAVKSGLGVAPLPCFAAELDRDLVRCLRAAPVAGRQLWLLTHERVRHAPRVRAVIDFLAARLIRHAALVRDRLALEPWDEALAAV